MNTKNKEAWEKPMLKVLKFKKTAKEPLPTETTIFNAYGS